MFAGAALAAVFNRNGAVAPRVDNAFQRQISTTSLAAASSAVVSNANTLSLSVPWKPGGGALVVAANAQWLVESFEKYQDVPGYRLADLGYNQYRFGGEAQWRFLPRTSGLLQAGYFTRVPNVSNRPDEASGFDVLAGLTGLLTPRIAATAKVGYGSTSTKANAAFGTLAASKDASSVLADVSVEWLPADTVSFKTGYTRSLGLDPTVAAYAADGVNAGFRVKLADTYALRVGGRWDRLSFEAISGRDDDVPPRRPHGRGGVRQVAQRRRRVRVQHADRLVADHARRLSAGLREERGVPEGRRHLLTGRAVAPPAVDGAGVLRDTVRPHAPPGSLVAPGRARRRARARRLHPSQRRSPTLPESVQVGASTLGPGDVIEVRVYREAEISGVYQVGAEGDVVFPLCQRVVVSGLTPNGAADKFRACLASGFLRDPQVTVVVKEYNSKKVFVFGEVQKPGTFTFQDGMTVVQAVTLAGGFTRSASQNSTSVTRRVKGQEVKVKVNVQDIALGKAPNFTLEPGDIVFVPESLF